MDRTALIIPVRNAAAHLDRLLPALAAQTRQPCEILIVDSASTDNSAARLRAFGARIETIDPAQFNHGGTRRWASELVDAQNLIFLTQDAVPASPESFSKLIEALHSEADIGLVYGRQLPHPEAGFFGSQARRFNYPQSSCTKRLSDRARLGIKTCFSSNSFAAYRRAALHAAGGFPNDVIGSEDTYVAARMLICGYGVRYAADAEVYHSHDYSAIEEFRRYFDIGVFHGREYWIHQAFGSANGEGRRYVQAELAALREAGATHLIPEALLRNALKLLGFHTGQFEHHLPRALKTRISMFATYWK
jgi:rhamnosyltransferase